jgi:hypothetical protein
LTASMYSHFAGHRCEPGVEMAHGIQRVVGEPTPSIRQFPWALAYALSPFVTVFREMLELGCLRQRPLRLDNATLVALLGAEPHTTIDAALRATLLGLGCLPDGNRRPIPRAAAQASSVVR